MECLEGCNYQHFSNMKFFCEYYENALDAEMGARGEDDNIIVYRCKECIDEGKIGVDQESNLLEGIRKSLVYLGDHFYSFKDAFEEDLADLYRHLKALERKKEKGE